MLNLVCKIDMTTLIRKMKTNVTYELYPENTILFNKLLDQAMKSEVIIFEYSELEDNFCVLTRLAFPILDLMEDSNGNVTVYFVYKEPNELKQFVINKIDKEHSLSKVEKSKYLSRLNRLL